MAGIKADEITKIIREQIENYETKVSVDEVGTVELDLPRGDRDGWGRRVAHLASS